MPGYGRTFLLLFFAPVVAGCKDSSLIAPPDAGIADGASETPPLDATADARAQRIEVIGTTSTAQLVAQLTNPDLCESGWTELWRDRFEEGGGEEDWIALQPRWVEQVDSYGDLLGLAQRLADTERVLNPEIPTLRVSLFWPCFVANPAVRQEFADLVEIVQDAGYTLELALLHHGSYPAELHEHPDFGMVGGWAHPDASSLFQGYADLVLAELAPLLPAGAVIYLAIEPIPQLLDGYVHRVGSYPPGGRNAGRSLALALVNLRDALLATGLHLRDAGFRPAIAVNIRPLIGKRDAPGSSLLERLHNEWLLAALIEGCIDNDFDGECEDYHIDQAIKRLGVTYYGTMHASADTVEEFGLPGELDQPLARRDFRPSDFTPNYAYFQLALQSVLKKYGDRIADGTLEFGVAEIGLSDGNPTIQLGWLNDYLGVIEKMPVTFLGFHAVFEHAEFSSGDFYFHLVGRCAPCELTDWGRMFLEQMAIWNRK